MDELYTTTLGNVTKIAYEETNNDGTDVDNHRKYYREFDYGIDTENNIIFIQDEIQSGLTFDIVSKVRLLKKINGNVDTVNGMAMSAAALLLANGTGTRAASKHSKIMVHQLSTIVVGKLSDVKSNAKFSEELETECNQLMAESTKMDKDYWQNIQSSDYFMSAEKALELGIIDVII